MSLKFLRWCLLALLFWGTAGWAASFTVEDIEVVGARKISVGTVLNYLPVKVGEDFVIEKSPEVIKALYETGFFDQVELFFKKQSLIIKVKERPAIAEINFSGNTEIEDEPMEETLKQQGLSRGKIFNELILDKIKQELRLLYYSLGKYAVRVETEVRELDEGRVAIDIDISEGQPARIRNINIVGNSVFDEEDLLDEFDLESSDDGWFPSDKYSSVKLSGDLEKLKSYYLDRGYVNFDIDSKQVTISPDRKDINISVNVHEGELYHINKTEVVGDLVVPAEELLALVPFRQGDVFSRKQVTAVLKHMKERIGEEGYAFANVSAVPEIDDDAKTVDLKYVVEPGQKTMVRFINFYGNTKTRDVVLRREMRQLESELYRASKVERSKIRLQRLKFVGSASIQLQRVPGETDQVDLDVTISERFSGNFQIGAGYSQAQGALLNLSLKHDNVFGSGKTVGLEFNNNASQEKYRFSFVNPYHTADGVSRGFLFDYSKTDAEEAAFSNYLLDKIAFSVNYRIPLSEYNSISYRLGLERNELAVTDNTSTEIYDFIRANNAKLAGLTNDDIMDDEYDSVFGTLGFSIDSRNRLIFPNKGNFNSIGIELHGGDLDFYKLNYRNQFVFPIGELSSFSLKMRTAYGKAYNETSDLPFFEKYTAGGVRTVRGYDYNSLGPKDSNDRTFGGNVQFVTNAEFLFPVEALGGTETFRLGVYFDAGNVFENTAAFDTDELRTSTGLSLKWFSVVGPLEFSYAYPLNNKPGDDIQKFQFTLGAAF